jgi:hypothetical protein
VPTPPNTGPSDYEKNARLEIHAWKNPKLGWFGWAMHTINWPFEKAGELAMKVPGIEWVIQKACSGLLGVLNDAAQYTVRHDTIFENFRKSGHPINSHADIYNLDLEDIDRVIGWLAMKYKGAALVEGTGAGAAGFVGVPAGIAAIPVDVVAVIGMALRAIGEYATHYGFDISSQHERLFAMTILGYASSPSDAAKTTAMAHLTKIAVDVAKRKAWKDLQDHAFVVVLQKLANSVGVRLTKAKLAQAVPAAGAVIGGGFNAYYVSKVCDAAYFLYRERFLAQKYGPDFIDQSYGTADDYDFPDDPE